MELNERAAKCMEWEVDYMGNYYSGGVLTGYQNGINRNTDAPPCWNPREDYKHARMLYQRVVEKGLEGKLEEFIYFELIPEAVRAGDCIKGVLRLTAEQLTLACCEVLEDHDV